MRKRSTSIRPDGKRARIVYVGAERVGLACLRRLISLRKQVVAVFTAHEALRSSIADFVSFGASLPRRHFPLIRIKGSDTAAFAARVKAFRPDLVVVVSWSQRIPPRVVHAAPRGCVGIHYSLLPQRRGGAPLSWALMDGLTESGLTLFYLDEELDTGDIIAQKRFAISRTDTVKTLLDKIVVLAPQLLAEQIDAIEQGTAPRLAQDESQASYTPRRAPAQSEIDWSQPPESIYNFIRALAPPYPSAFTQVGGRKLVIPSARLEHGRLWTEGFLE